MRGEWRRAAFDGFDAPHRPQKNEAEKNKGRVAALRRVYCTIGWCGLRWLLQCDSRILVEFE